MTMQAELTKMSPTAATLYAAYHDSCREAGDFEYCMLSGRHDVYTRQLNAIMLYWDTWLDALYEAFRQAEAA